MRVAVTGGAGYIGSHMVRALLRANHEVVIIDNLSAGFRDTIPPGVRLFELDVQAGEPLKQVLVDSRVEAIFHFASRIQVGESVKNPKLYYRDNLAAAVSLLDSALSAGVSYFILSSTAAVYGNPVSIPIKEDDPTLPVNPYGETKLAIERMLASYAHAYGLSYAALRYFNASGAEPGSGLGERHDPETHLIPIVLEAALGIRPNIAVYGQDYPTPDGTCVRDYVHVTDLASAHLAACAYLMRGGKSGAFNLGTGQGYSVRQVIDVAKRVSKRDVPVINGPRREGDPPILVASPKRAEEVLGWRPTRSSLEQIVQDAWQWHSSRAGV